MTATVTPLPANTDVAETLGGKAHSRAILFDGTGADAMGAVAASPAANTLLGRLKAIADLLGLTNGYVDGIEALLGGAATDAKLESVRLLLAGAATAAKQDSTKASIDAQAPADDIWPITNSDNALAPVPRALLVLTSGTLILKGSSGTATPVPVVAGQQISLKARYVMAASTATVAGLA